MEPEPTLASLLEAIQTLTSQVGSLQAKSTVKANSSLSSKAICKETNDLVGGQGPRRSPSQAWPIDWAYHSPHTHRGEAHTPGTVRPGLKAPFCPSRERALTQKKRKNPGGPQREPGDTPKRSLSSLTPFDSGLAGICRPNAKRAAARKIAALTQTTTTSEYVTKFRNLMAELDWNTEAYIAQFVRGLHWKVKELLSTKDNIPDNDLEAIFAALVKIDNIRRENKENRPKKDPNYVTPEERDRRRASGLCVKCGQKGHGIKQCPNGWKASVKEVAKIAKDVESGKD
ncbi:Retrotransposon-derived protein PEG10 [Rhizoctonia solani]|uniref:Retrotransposon-derived protein PEG10 n=1 Tax=Rhizoctonia solani TaxID=456999 RepID=A0A8H7M644_9AGAM|nr:Retrotransposon-derived protein PEG10 [Rhizoctonia solani]